MAAHQFKVQEFKVKTLRTLITLNPCKNGRAEARPPQQATAEDGCIIKDTPPQADRYHVPGEGILTLVVARNAGMPFFGGNTFLGTQKRGTKKSLRFWIPACAGMTVMVDAGSG